MTKIFLDRLITAFEALCGRDYWKNRCIRAMQLEYAYQDIAAMAYAELAALQKIKHNGKLARLALNRVEARAKAAGINVAGF